MLYHTLLQKQARKFLSNEQMEDESILRFLESVNNAYTHFERDKKLAEHAFTVSEKEYQDILKAKLMVDNVSKAKSEFMASMSHELRTPMNAIIGFTDLLLTTELKNTQHEHVEIVQRSAHNLLDIINDILDFSKIEAGKLTLDKAPLNLTKLVEETVDMLAIKAFQKDLEVICKTDPEFPYQLLGDPVRIRQILINLLGNAVKFTCEGEIMVSLIKEDIICKEDNKTYQTFSIMVKDTGIGIPAEKLHTIFESFSQADSSTTRKFGGTGLGLTIARNLAEMMKGSLQVTSEQGKGSTFTLQLTLEVAAAQQPVVLPKPLLRRILVVDDNHTNCLLMQGIFEYLDIHCITSNSGLEALTIIERSINDQEPFDLVITDHHMPVMDGITLVKEIKRVLSGSPQPFILMLSSLEKSLYQQEAEKIGINKFLCKPVKIQDLNHILLSVFEKTEQVETFNPAKSFIQSRVENVSILVAEDEPINMLLISQVLNKMGFTVIKAANGIEAIELLTQSSPALIFMDINMPEMDGYTATAAIRQLPAPLSSIPIIALTADAMKEDKIRCLEVGMNDYMSKPFRLEDIEKILRNYMLVA
jgi:signal transduction histidine kinase/CheY-like chemotaxis protein